MKLLLYTIPFVFFSLTPAVFAQDGKENKQIAKDKAERETQVVTGYEVTKIKVRDSIFLLKGKGGNVAVQMGKEGILVIDSQFEASAPEIIKTIQQVSNRPIKFLINTHHHGDHTGGNGYMNNLGITTIAQERVRQRIIEKENEAYIKEQKKAYEDYLKEAENKGLSDEKAKQGAKEILQEMEANLKGSELLPTITFGDNLSFYFNNDKVIAFHVHNAHTDGDVMIFFSNSNVIHTGDAFVQGGYPFIDTANGGTLDGYMKGLSRIMMMTDEETKIIPGHGDLATREDVSYSYKMLEYLKNSISYHRINKKTEDEVVAMKDITKDFDAKGFGKGFISSEKIVRTIYQEVAKRYPWK